MDASLEVGTFPRLTTGTIITSDQHELFTKFLKLKPPVFKGAESEDAYDFLVDCHELLHKMDIVERFRGMPKCGGGRMLSVNQHRHHP